MTTSIQKFTKEWIFDNDQALSEFTVTGTGAVAMADAGVELQTSAASQRNMVAFARTPYTIKNLVAMEILFRADTVLADSEFTFGVTQDAGTSPDPGVHNVIALAKVMSKDVLLGFNDGDGRSAFDITTHVAVAEGEWIRGRLDFAQEYQTVSPPNPSRGSQVTCHITAAPRAFAQHAFGNTQIDMFGAREQGVSVFFGSGVGATGSATKFTVRQICLEWNSPDNRMTSI